MGHCLRSKLWNNSQTQIFPYFVASSFLFYGIPCSFEENQTLSCSVDPHLMPFYCTLIPDQCYSCGLHIQYPLVNVYITMERSTMLSMDKSTISAGQCSIANFWHNQRVNQSENKIGSPPQMICFIVTATKIAHQTGGPFGGFSTHTHQS